MRLAGIDIDAPPQVVLPVFALGLLALAMLAARVARRAAARWLAGGAVDGTATRAAPPTLGVPVTVAVLSGGVLLVVPELALPGRVGRWLGDVLDVTLIVACAFAVSRVTVAAVTEYAARNPSVSPALGVARVAARVVVAILAVIMALESLGVPVAPLLTTLGVGSLAVALALQETLANFFAGLYLLADRPVRAGDYIKIHDGEEGYVETIGWRSSRLRTQKQNIVIVPNQKLSQAILTNFQLPSPEIAMSVVISIGRDEDPAAAGAVLEDELARAARELPQLRAKPVARLIDVTDGGQVWSCAVQARDVEAQAVLGHELRLRILARLRRDRIALGTPARAVRVAGDVSVNPTAPPPPAADADRATEIAQTDSLTAGKGTR